MALSVTQLSDLLFKKVFAGKATTDTNKAFFEEAINSRKSVFADDVWTQSGLIPSTAPSIAPDAMSGVVQYKFDEDLVPIAGTNSFTTGITDIIPFNFGDGSYNYILKDGNGSQIAPGTADWLIDAETGVVTFFDGGGTFLSIIATGTLTLTVYRYVGLKGVGSGGGGGGTGTLSGWLNPALSIDDNTAFEIIAAGSPSNGDRYLVSTITNAVITIYDTETLTATANQVVAADSVLEYFNDSGNGGANAGWIIDFDGSSPTAGTSITILDEPGTLYQFNSGVWTKYSFENTVPGREYKSLLADVTITDGDEATATALAGGLTFIPTPDTYVAIMINGIQVSIEDTNSALASVTSHCYFSDDGGVNSKDLSQLSAGDRLYWVGTNAEYNLDATDRIDINFVKN